MVKYENKKSNRIIYSEIWNGQSIRGTIMRNKKTEKEVLLQLINDKGDCDGGTSCNRCPFDIIAFDICSSQMKRPEANKKIYDLAIKAYIEKYGKEELFEKIL